MNAGKVKRLVAYRFRLYPSIAQKERMEAWQSALRYLWNANRSALPVEGTPPEGSRRSRKRRPMAVEAVSS